ncbi:MAG: aldo/keto reductase [Thermoflexales bacterium]|nr:aldo/keto reductase [Thermoflexales bacterium]
MNYHSLGKSDISVSALAMGCWALAGDATWGPQDQAQSTATVRAALDAGVNFFDTAEGYGGGDSELALGQALAGRRHAAVIATKVSRAGLSGSQVLLACERSLQRLQTDYIDLYQIHWPSRTVPLDETLEALERLREQGKIRAAGVCNFGVQDLTELLQVAQVETNQLPYSLLWRAIEDEIKPKCVEAGVGILCYSSLAQGLLSGKFSSPDEVPEGRARTRFFSKERSQARHGEAGCEAETFAAIERIRHICGALGQPMAKVALAWLLYQEGVSAVIAGARSPAQIQETAQATELELPAELVDELSQATDDLKQKLGPNPDMWQSESRFR